MPYKSQWHVDIPKCSLPTLVFKNPRETLDDKKPCFLDAGRPESRYFTPSTYRLWCQRFALGLQRSGKFGRGDRLLLFSGNDLFYPVVFMGVIMAGGIFTGANPNYVARELAHQLEDSAAKYLLCAESSMETAIEAANLVGMPKNHVFVFNGAIYDELSAPSFQKQNGYRNWAALVAAPDDAKTFQWDDLHWPEDACHRTLALNYSSGTTGQPKGVEITHLNYISNCLQYTHLASLKEDYQARTARARWLNFLPLYHAMSQTINIVCSFLRGIPVYIMKRFDFIQMLQYVEKYRITSLTLVPPVVVALAKHPAVKEKKYDLSSVEGAGSGAAPLGFEVTMEFNNLWPEGQVSLTQGWGMTE
jgi:4-coumarate--CoA ligase